METEDQRVHIPENIIAGLKKWAEVERKRMDNPLIKELITWRSLANQIIANEVKKQGYFVAKKGLK